MSVGDGIEAKLIVTQKGLGYNYNMLILPISKIENTTTKCKLEAKICLRQLTSANPAQFVILHLASHHDRVVLMKVGKQDIKRLSAIHQIT